MSTTATMIRFRSVSAPERVDMEKGIIYGVSAMQLVQPKGHPIAVDQATLEAIVRLGNARTAGIKSHFKHRDVEAGEDALGTQVARARNFRITGDKAVCDVHMLSSAKISPNGNLHDYVLKFADESPEDFGMSVIMRFARAWKMADGSEVIAKDRPTGAVNDLPLARPTKLGALDFVDDPAANEDGLFSAGDDDTDEPPTNGYTMKIPQDRLAALKTEFAAFSALILDSALAGDDEIQLRAKIGEARLKALSDEVTALKAKSEKQETDHAAALKALTEEKTALQSKYDALAKLASGNDPGSDASAFDTDEEKLKAKFESDKELNANFGGNFKAYLRHQKQQAAKSAKG